MSSNVLGSVSQEKIVDFKARYHAVTGKISPCSSSSPLIVSLDECSFSEKVRPLYGYSPVGEKCKLSGRNGSWKQRSLLLGITSRGDYTYRIKDGSFNRKSFGECVATFEYPPGTVILLDNCTIHKKLEDVFALKGYIPLFLSPYSPQFQPVELAFSKTKNHFRSLWPWSDGIATSIEQSIATLTSVDILGYFRHARQQLEIA